MALTFVQQVTIMPIQFLLQNEYDGYKDKLGHGDQELKSKLLPTLIMKVKLNRYIITVVACGGLHSVALCHHEAVFT